MVSPFHPLSAGELARGSSCAMPSHPRAHLCPEQAGATREGHLFSSPLFYSYEQAGGHNVCGAGQLAKAAGGCLPINTQT